MAQGGNDLAEAQRRIGVRRRRLLGSGQRIEGDVHLRLVAEGRRRARARGHGSGDPARGCGDCGRLSEKGRPADGLSDLSVGRTHACAPGGSPRNPLGLFELDAAPDCVFPAACNAHGGRGHPRLGCWDAHQGRADPVCCRGFIPSGAPVTALGRVRPPEDIGGAIANRRHGPEARRRPARCAGVPCARGATRRLICDRLQGHEISRGYDGRQSGKDCSGRATFVS